MLHHQVINKLQFGFKCTYINQYCISTKSGISIECFYYLMNIEKMFIFPFLWNIITLISSGIFWSLVQNLKKKRMRQYENHFGSKWVIEFKLEPIALQSSNQNLQLYRVQTRTSSSIEFTLELLALQSSNQNLQLYRVQTRTYSSIELKLEPLALQSSNQNLQLYRHQTRTSSSIEFKLEPLALQSSNIEPLALQSSNQNLQLTVSYE